MLGLRIGSPLQLPERFFELLTRLLGRSVSAIRVQLPAHTPSLLTRSATRASHRRACVKSRGKVGKVGILGVRRRRRRA